MAKADDDVIRSWIWLRDAKKRATDRYQSPDRSEECIREWLEAGKLRWRCVDPADRSGDATFFQNRPLVPENRPDDEFFVIRLHHVTINFDESSAERFAPHGKVYGIQVAQNDLDKLLPPPAETSATGNRKRPSAAETVAREIFPPEGKPPAAMSTPEAVKKLGDEIERRGSRLPSDDTLKRAMGRR